MKKKKKKKTEKGRAMAFAATRHRVCGFHSVATSISTGYSDCVGFFLNKNSPNRCRPRPDWAVIISVGKAKRKKPNSLCHSITMRIANSTTGVRYSILIGLGWVVFSSAPGMDISFEINLCDIDAKVESGSVCDG